MGAREACVGHKLGGASRPNLRTLFLLYSHTRSQLPTPIPPPSSTRIQLPHPTPHPYQVDVRCAAYRACCTALEVRGGEAEQPQSMGIFHVQAFAHGDGKPPHAVDHCNLPTTYLCTQLIWHCLLGKPVYANHHRQLLFYDEARGAWQIAAKIGPRATVAAGARGEGVPPQGPDGLCPDRAGAYYVLRRNASAGTAVKGRWVPGVTMRCLDNIATHSAVGLGKEQGVVAEADAGSVQPSGDRKALVGEGLRGTRGVHCCAAVQVHPMHTRDPNQIARDPEPVTLLSRSRVARA